MTFDEWYERNKEPLTQKTFEGAFRTTWQAAWRAAWAAAINKHWMEAYHKGRADERKDIWDGD